jgi:hypothetical protein
VIGSFDGPIVAQCGRRRGPRHLGVVVHGRVHTTQLLGTDMTESDLDDERPVDPHLPLGHVQSVVAFEGILEEGPSTAFLMGLQQCGLKRGVPPFGRRRPAPTDVFVIIFADRDRALLGSGEEARRGREAFINAAINNNFVFLRKQINQIKNK